MNAIAFFPALSQAIFLSLGQALIIYILLKLTLAVLKGLSASWRYNLLYSSLVLICAGFIMSFFRYYNALADITTEFADKTLIIPTTESVLLSWKTITFTYSSSIVGIYFSGVVIQSLILIMAFYRLKYQNLKNTIPVSAFWENRLEDLKLRLKISRKITLYLSDELLIPLTAGFIKPVILLPIAMINQLTAEQTEAILLHELAHIKRHDYLMNILQRVMEIILFFNPVIWVLTREIKKEREFCCDDLVLQNFDSPGNYARALALVEENRISINNLAMAVTGNKKFNLFHRIQRLTNMKTLQTNPKQRLLAVITILAISISLAWVMPADSTKAKKPAKELRLNKLRDTTQLIPPPVPPAPVAPDTWKSLQLPAAPEGPIAQDQETPKPPVPPAPIDTNELKNLYNSAEWTKQIEQMKIEAEKMKKHFDSPEWKKQMKEMKIAGEEMKKQFDSPEWKKQIEQMKISGEEMKKQLESPEWKKQMEQIKISGEEMKKQFDSPEWKKQMEQMKIETEKMKKQFDSPEWKRQMEQMKIETEKMKKQYDSPERKKQMEQMKIETEKMKKQYDSPERKKQMEQMKIETEN